MEQERQCGTSLETAFMEKTRPIFALKETYVVGHLRQHKRK